MMNWRLNYPTCFAINLVHGTRVFYFQKRFFNIGLG